ncbi:MAG TPA: hypothetical protein VHW00_25720 [Thermoanaerobaculia bacterium]|nr:hypothetical protein [Thermoanaerobaculia bacterium]
MTDLPPEPLSRNQRTIVLVLAVVCAATRFLSMARSLWDWDEALFALGMRDFDVTHHHPHPPGFPVYIGIAKLLRFVIPSDFRALQAVNLIAGMLAFVAMFLFARELRLRFSTCAIAASLFTFFPNVWFFGGGAFSDVPSIVLVLFAVTFLLRGVRDRNSYFLGTLLLALAIGIRPQNFLLGLVPGLIATRRRKPLEILTALLIGVIVVGIAFGSAVYATGSYDDYMRIVREHGDYISRIDSWRSDARPPMWRLFDRFFIKQYQSTPLSILATLFVLVSAVGSIRERNRSMLVNVLTFAPFAVVAWMMLDRFSISRFSIGYQPMFAILLADGIHRVTRRRASFEPAIAMALAISFAVFALPAFTAVRNEIAPSIVSAREIAQHVDFRRGDQLLVGHTMTKFVDLAHPGLPYVRVLDDRALPIANGPRTWLLAEITRTGEEGFVFKREHGHLWNIARRHYFDIKLAPIQRRAQFASGWYAPESMEFHQWRWMARGSVTLLPPAEGETMLRLQFGLPAGVTNKNPKVTIKLNGAQVDEFRTTAASVERDVRVMPVPRDRPNVLELSIDQSVTPADDGRELGLCLRSLSWGPA